MKKVWGYARVSSKDQNPERQVKILLDAGVEERNVLIDKESGKNFERVKYQLLKQMLREGDVVMVPSIDRLGRDYLEISREWEDITKNIGADIVILDMELLDTRRKDDLTGQLLSDIVLRLLSYVAEVERRDIRERQRQGIELAKLRGVYGGRKPISVDTVRFAALLGEVRRGERTARYVMGAMGLKPNTYYNLVKEYDTRTGRFAD